MAPEPSGAHLSLAVSRALMRSPPRRPAVGREHDLGDASGAEHSCARCSPWPSATAIVGHVLVALVRSAEAKLDSPGGLADHCSPDAHPALPAAAELRSQPRSPLLAPIAQQCIRRMSGRIGRAVAAH